MRSLLFVAILLCSCSRSPAPKVEPPPIPDLRKKVANLNLEQALKEIDRAMLQKCFRDINEADNFDVRLAQAEGCRRLKSETYVSALKERVISLNPQWKKAEIEDIRAGKIKIGQTPDQLKVLLGSPDSITTDSSGDQIFHYNEIGFVLFRKGKILRWSFTTPPE